MTNTSQPTVELKKFIVTAIEPGIIENFVKPGETVEEEDIAELRRCNLELAENKPYSVLIISGHLSSITKEARELSASKEFAGITRAKALIVESLGHRIVGSFYIRVNKPHIRTRLFASKEPAIQWLRKQMATPQSPAFQNN